MPGALHVLGGEGLAVVPLDAFSQLEGQLGLARVPRPALAELRHDGGEAVQRLGLVEQHEIVEHRHEGLGDRDGGLLVQRGARRVVAMVDPERAALLLRRRRYDAGKQGHEHRGGNGRCACEHGVSPIRRSCRLLGTGAYGVELSTRARVEADFLKRRRPLSAALSATGDAGHTVRIIRCLAEGNGLMPGAGRPSLATCAAFSAASAARARSAAAAAAPGDLARAFSSGFSAESEPEPEPDANPDRRPRACVGLLVCLFGSAGSRAGTETKLDAPSLGGGDIERHQRQPQG